MYNLVWNYYVEKIIFNFSFGTGIIIGNPINRLPADKVLIMCTIE